MVHSLDHNKLNIIRAPGSYTYIIYFTNFLLLKELYVSQAPGSYTSIL